MKAYHIRYVVVVILRVESHFHFKIEEKLTPDFGVTKNLYITSGTNVFKISMELFFQKGNLIIHFISSIKSPTQTSLSLVGFKDTLRLYKSVKGVLQTAVLSGNHKTKFALLFRLLTQTKEQEKYCQE